MSKEDFLFLDGWYAQERQIKSNKLKAEERDDTTSQSTKRADSNRLPRGEYESVESVVFNSLEKKLPELASFRLRRAVGLNSI
jgi:hypothetical protein